MATANEMLAGLRHRAEQQQQAWQQWIQTPEAILAIIENPDLGPSPDNRKIQNADNLAKLLMAMKGTKNG